MVAGLFKQSSPEQKAGLLNQLLGSLGPAAAQALASAGGMAALTNLLKGGTGVITPQQAEQVSPQAVALSPPAPPSPGVIPPPSCLPPS